MRKLIGFNEAKKFLDRRATPGRSQDELVIATKVSEIISDVQKNGDKALSAYTHKFDGIKLEAFELSQEEILSAYKRLNIQLRMDLKLAAKRIKAYNVACKNIINMRLQFDHIEKQVRPLEKIGVYIPGGTASYPSTVLMTAIPAKVAGVKEIIMVTPPRNDGNISDITLSAAYIAKVDRIFKVGGAQAIAALAFGTESIPRVDKICGPGNIFVATAKKLVYGTVDIDGIQGPSEIVLVADSSAKPSHCAADLIAQSEHDEMSTAIMITNSLSLANHVEDEIKKQVSALTRKSIINNSLNSRGVIIVVNTIDEAIDLVNLFSPEHLSIMVENGNSYKQKIKNAGCVFIGDTSPVAFGDYIAGPSHVLPTGGTARFASVLAVESFLKQINFVSLTKKERDELAPIVINIAHAEGLDGHANAINIRLKD